jgi:hypothetical protein
MTDQAAAPADTSAAPPAQPDQGTQESKPTPPQSREQQALAMLGRARDGRFTPAPPGVEPPPPAAKPPPAPPADDLAAARAQQERLRAAREQVEGKKTLEQAQAKLQELAVFEGKDPAAIVRALKARGVTLEQLAKGELDAPDEPPDESPRERELRERLEKVEAREREQAESRHRADRRRRNRVAVVARLRKRCGSRVAALPKALGGDQGGPRRGSDCSWISQRPDGRVGPDSQHGHRARSLAVTS